MAKVKRHKTKYPGVYFIIGHAIGSNKTEKIYYIRYRIGKKQVEEKAGRQFKDDMTPAKAAGIRSKRIEGDQLSNEEARNFEATERSAEKQKWTIGRLFHTYIENRKPGKSKDIDAGRYNKYIKPHFEGIEPKDLLALDVKRLENKMLTKVSPQTTKHVLNLLTWIINFGTKNGLCQGAGFHIKKPTVNNTVTEDLNEKQLRSLIAAIDACSNIQISNLMRMALFSGMRRSELFKLQWTHIDFDRGFILIKDPKGKQDERIPLNENSREALLSHPKTENSPYVFPGKYGNQRVTCSAGVNKIKKAAGLPRSFRPMHGLRHTYASMLASSGKVDMYTLQKLLTHKDSRMTQRYAHLRDGALKRAAQVADGIITSIQDVNDCNEDDQPIRKKNNDH